MQEIVEGENAHFLFQQVGPLRTHALQVFNGISQYVFGVGNGGGSFGKNRDEWLMSDLVTADYKRENGLLSSCFDAIICYKGTYFFSFAFCLLFSNTHRQKENWLHSALQALNLPERYRFSWKGCNTPTLKYYSSKRGFPVALKKKKEEQQLRK